MSNLLGKTPQCGWASAARVKRQWVAGSSRSAREGRCERTGTSGRTADIFNPHTGEVQGKLALASKDILELQGLIKDSLLDLKTSRQRDEKGKRTKEAAPATAQERPMEEIDLVALSVKAHIQVHRSRNKKRS